MPRHTLVCETESALPPANLVALPAAALEELRRAAQGALSHLKAYYPASGAQVQLGLELTANPMELSHD